MDIVCRHCNATYTIADHKVPARKAAATCKRCGNRIVIAPRTAEASLPAEPAAMPQAAPQKEATPGAGHERALVEAFPEVSGFHPARYAMSEILPPNRKGHYRTRRNKFKLKILTVVKPTLDALLQQDERVMRIGGGTAYYPAEIFFGNGFLTMLYNRYALVATDRRLVMINTNHRMTGLRHYLFQMPYSEIKKVSRGLFRTSLNLVRKKGRRRLFTSMKMAFTRELRTYIAAQLTPETAAVTDAKPLECLCPACTTALPGYTAACGACGATFKSARKAALRSLLLPGWGDWYLGHRLLGGLELMGSLFVWSIALNLLFQGGAEDAGLAACILLFYNGFDALLTRHMARKGVMLEARTSAPRTRTQLAAGHA